MIFLLFLIVLNVYYVIILQVGGWGGLDKNENMELTLALCVFPFCMFQGFQNPILKNLNGGLFQWLFVSPFKTL